MTLRTLITGAVVAVGLAAPAQAATFDIFGTIANGVFAGETGSGTITYDETLLTGSGSESLGPLGTSIGIEDASLDINFGVGADIFTAMNDVNFPDFPLFDFIDGALDSIDYVVVDGEGGADLAPYEVVAGTFVVDSLFFNVTDNRYEVSIELLYVSDLNAVPLPAGFPMLAAGLGLLAFMRRRNT